ncbi:hypothetical protein PG994_002843 [Apiospora phragmitis]|uniref:Rhodopsin domain-containing protein n=1 Tax=Apiospora phragmitis TaxID=2905665 RepID=A0ABR1W6B0_9PEZI
MALTAIAAVVFILAIANICHPITMLWGATTQGSCNPSLNSTVSFFFSAVSIVTDLVLAILPGIMLWNIRMKKTVKFSVMIILGLAAFASCATVVRLRYLTLYNDQTEFMYSTGAIGLWSILEEVIGIIAGSLPALRPLLSLRALRGNGQSTGGTSASDANHLPGGLELSSSSSSSSSRDPSSSGSLRGWGNRRGSAKGGYGNEDDDGDSQRQIMKEVHVTVEAEDSDQAVSDDWIRQQVLGGETSR